MVVMLYDDSNFGPHEFVTASWHKDETRRWAALSDELGGLGPEMMIAF